MGAWAGDKRFEAAIRCRHSFCTKCQHVYRLGDRFLLLDAFQEYMRLILLSMPAKDPCKSFGRNQADHPSSLLTAHADCLTDLHCAAATAAARPGTAKGTTGWWRTRWRSAPRPAPWSRTLALGPVILRATSEPPWCGRNWITCALHHNSG